MMKNEKRDDNISEIFQDDDKIREAIQAGIHAALLRHKQAGNPVCEWKDGKVVWVAPENILVDNNHI